MYIDPIMCTCVCACTGDDGKCCIRVCSCVSFSKLDLRARRAFIAEKVGAILKNAPPDDVRNVTGLLAWLCMCVCMCMCLCVYACVCCPQISALLLILLLAVHMCDL